MTNREKRVLLERSEMALWNARNLIDALGGESAVKEFDTDTNDILQGKKTKGMEEMEQFRKIMREIGVTRA